jgi:hypothetical protein
VENKKIKTINLNEYFLLFFHIINIIANKIIKIKINFVYFKNNKPETIVKSMDVVISINYLKITCNTNKNRIDYCIIWHIYINIIKDTLLVSVIWYNKKLV